MTNTNARVPGDLPEWLAVHADEIAAWGPAPVARGCWVIGCRRDAHLHGLCKTHHYRAARAWNPRPSQLPKAEKAAIARAFDSETKTRSTNTTA